MTMASTRCPLIVDDYSYASIFALDTRSWKVDVNAQYLYPGCFEYWLILSRRPLKGHPYFCASLPEKQKIDMVRRRCHGPKGTGARRLSNC
jgi:hypothetical protein